jgi:hypothetical protein
VAVEARLTHPEAEQAVASADRERSQFVQENFQQSDSNPLLYDLVINTEQMTVETAAELVARAAEAAFPSILETAAPRNPAGFCR